MTQEELMQELTRYALIDPEDTDAVETLRESLTAAEAYLANAGAQDYSSPLYALCARKLALYYFEQRAPDPRYGYMPPPPDLDALILSIRTSKEETP